MTIKNVENENITSSESKIKKKPGRKPKTQTLTEEKVPKKRGRKPKGGKIVNENEIIKKTKKKAPKQNIILHLKCNSQNLQMADCKVKGTLTQIDKLEPAEVTSSIMTTVSIKGDVTKENDINSVIHKKIKLLNNTIHHNTLMNKNSSCFWCTYEFSNPPCYIPEKKISKQFYVYGCFCSPECAGAYLFNQNIDSSTKWERYSLLNTMYMSIYNYKKNIKLAPNPHYLLDKFYGNLTIEEYRKTFSQNKLLMLIDKPLTLVIPEIYEDNNEFTNKITDNKTKIKSKNIFN